jgi:predicted Zn finger-like uncharacterized protein
LLAFHGFRSVNGPLLSWQAMQIVCPSCATSYQIAEMAVGASGRSVRCSRCQHVWHAAPSPVASPADHASAFRAEPREEQPEAASVAPESAEPPGEPIVEEASPDGIDLPPTEAVDDTAGDSPDGAPMALSEIPIPVASAPPGMAVPSPEIDNAPPDIESVAARRPRTASRKHKPRGRLPLAAAIAALMLVSAMLVSFRKDVVRHAPQLASFYSAIHMPVNLRGMAFTDLKIGNEIHDGVPVLVIEGVIVSTTSKIADVPRLRFALRSASGAEVYSWTAPPTQPKLGAFETLPFRSRLASPPAEAHDIEVRFFTRHDSVASLR